MGERRVAYSGWVGKTEGERSFGRIKNRWVNDIKINVGKVRCGGMNWINLDQDKDRLWALVNAVMNFRAP
jgi:hypothetical protein